jgi:hypothetical protein
MSEAARLTVNLAQVEMNIRLFSLILDETTIPGTEAANDKKLLEKLEKSCLLMQKRLSILLSELTESNQSETSNYENIFIDGLRINEDLNSVFIRYQRFKNSRPVDESSGDVPLLPEEPVPTGLLIDVGPSESSVPPVSSPKTTNSDVNDEFWLNMTENTTQNRQPTSEPTEFEKFLDKK